MRVHGSSTATAHGSRHDHCASDFGEESKSSDGRQQLHALRSEIVCVASNSDRGIDGGVRALLGKQRGSNESIGLFEPRTCIIQ